ncbi:MAG: GFA family protein [Leptospirales bacterium]|nr:GFA family protein [Leptospirales bacterium]
MNRGYPPVYKGSCLCGRVRFRVKGPLSEPTACHCRQCRKHSGHFDVSTNVPRSSLKIFGAEQLSWYCSSSAIRRGFCSVCGSSLFWDPIDQEHISISMGAFDGRTDTELEKPIFVESKGDYYQLTDGLPQFAEWD